jgi:hypothetical protein
MLIKKMLVQQMLQQNVDEKLLEMLKIKIF